LHARPCVERARIKRRTAEILTCGRQPPADQFPAIHADLQRKPLLGAQDGAGSTISSRGSRFHNHFSEFKVGYYFIYSLSSDQSFKVSVAAPSILSPSGTYSGIALMTSVIACPAGFQTCVPHSSMSAHRGPPRP
jgi:hypothetical protein